MVMPISVFFPGMWPLKVGSEKFDDMLVLSFVGQTSFVSHSVICAITRNYICPFNNNESLY